MNNFESELIQKIEKNFEKIKDDLQSETKRKDFARYSALKQGYDNEVNIENNDEFKKIYRILYGMRFVTKEYVKKYFTLLNTRKFNSHNDLENFLRDTDGILDYKKNNSMQFCFATKAIHTANNKLPIYDRFVNNFFRLEAVPNDINLDVECRVKTRQRIYNELIYKFNSLLSKDEIKKCIKEIRCILDNTNSINDAKMLDFIILSCESGFKKNFK